MEPSRKIGVPSMVDDLFRRQSSRIIARLIRIFGPQHMELVEEVVQEALISALQKWPLGGIPSNPAAWITQVARNRALDQLRRGGLFLEKETEIRQQLEQLQSRSLTPGTGFEEEIRDDQLRLLFMCCHPKLTKSAQVALSLKILGGFSVREIARAFLSREATIAQRLVRAKRQIRESKTSLEMPHATEIKSRLESVLDVLYLMFNEGYAAHEGDRLIREDVCHESIRLAILLAQHPLTDRPRTHAVLALMAFQASRIPARLGPEGELRLLGEQDRDLWEPSLIQLGFSHFRLSIDGQNESAEHLQAAIAALHAQAPTYEETDWKLILSLYDRLAQETDSPVVRLNRAVAVSFVRGPEVALDLISELESDTSLEDYYLLPATKAAFLQRVGALEESRTCYEEALARRCSDPEARFLQRRIRACDDALTGTGGEG